MRVYHQVTARSRRQQAARTQFCFHMSPEPGSDEAPVEGLQNLKGEVVNAHSERTPDSFFLFLHSGKSVMASEQGRK
jgi:hypothetical protein